jgi:hypothetical protein
LIPGRSIRFLSSPNWLWVPPSLPLNGYWKHFPQEVKCGWAIKLVTHLYLVQRLRMSTAMPPLPYLSAWQAQGQLTVMNNIIILPNIPICSYCNIPKMVLFSFQYLLRCDTRDRYQCTGEIRCNHYQHRHMNSSILKREAANFPKTLVPMLLCRRMSQKETIMMTVRSVRFLKFTQF